MDPERWQRVARLYEATLEQEPEHRDAFLADESGDEVEVRREVESLLAQEAVPLLIDRPMLEAAAAVLDEEEVTIAIGTELGPYRIDRLVGAGGMGQVYRGTDTRLNRARASTAKPGLSQD
jgi:eukaryotic-like serine/threonine-protein kinase